MATHHTADSNQLAQDIAYNAPFVEQELATQRRLWRSTHGADLLQQFLAYILL